MMEKDGSDVREEGSWISTYCFEGRSRGGQEQAGKGEA